MSGFDRMGLHPSIIKALQHLNFTAPTPIQEKSIPPALLGRDILGSAQTGTGKTGAFTIPMVQYLLLNPSRNALVLTPTRELAQQVLQFVKNITQFSPAIKTALLIGGADMRQQTQALRQQPRIVVGTPGRIIDHLEQGTLFLGATEFLVLDETDRMLDMGFGIQLDKIRKFLKPGRQTLLFSATLPPNIKALTAHYLNDPLRIAVGGNSQPVEQITQSVIRTSAQKKFSVLEELLREEATDQTTIIFCKTKIGTERVAQKLNDAGLRCRAMNGDLSQSQRDSVLRQFRRKDFSILVATDVAARGLDINHIGLVVNFDLPQQPEDYIHRIGRTGRAGAEGRAVCLLTPEDGDKWRIINRMIERNKNRPHDEDMDLADMAEDRPAPKRKPRSRTGAKPAHATSRSAEPRKSEGKREGGRSEKRRFDGDKPEGRRSERKPDGFKSEGRKPEGRFEKRKFDESKPEGKREGDRSEKRRFDGDKPEGRRSERKPDGFKSEGRKPEGRFEKRKFDESKPEGKREGGRSEKRRFDGDQPEGRRSERKPDGFKSEGRKPDGFKGEGRKPQGKKPAFAKAGGKPSLAGDSRPRRKPSVSAKEA